MLVSRDLQRLSRDLSRAAGESPRGPDADRRRDQRRAAGAYFTPAPLVEFVVAETLRRRVRDRSIAWRDDGSPALRVLDPCAGDGRFLAAVVDYLARCAHRRGHDRHRAADAIRRRCIVGIERDREFARVARERLGPGARVHCAEALLDAPAQASGVDAVVGNPPYVRSIRFARTDPALWTALRGRYAATSHGEWDLYAAFIEQALEWIRPGGEVGLVVPSRWLTASFAARLRGKLAAHQAVRAVVDFGAEQLFAGATTYASVIFLSRSPNREVAVARRAGERWQCGQISSTSLGARPWRLAVGEQRALLDRLTGQAPPLGQLARIAKGAGTNADSVYVLDPAEPDRAVVHGWCKAATGERSPGAAGPVEVEAAACRPCLRGRDVVGYGRVGTQVQCIVPYDRLGALWTPDQLARHPLAAAHLARFRRRLEARERGRYADERYYRFGRPQNMAFFGARIPKIVIPDVARDGRALIDRTGAMVLDSAYAVGIDGAPGDDPGHPPGREGYSLPLLLAVLNSPVVGWWLRETGVPLRGGYLRLKTAYLQSLPLPPLGRAASEAAALAARADGRHPVSLELAERIADAVRRAYGVSEREWRELMAPR